MSFRKIYKKIRSLFYAGNSFSCPLCKKGARAFLPSGPDGRKSARCPHCSSFERHRLLWLLLEREWADGRLKSSGRLMHVAPEECLARHFKQGFDYVSIDMDCKRAMYAMDITKIDFPEESFDGIVCNHVLEHIPDDHKALSELFRVMKPGGWGSIQVPMPRETTFEDSSITTAEERLKMYGQDDHVRIYGRDYLDRLRKVGFDVLEYKKKDIITGDQDRKFSLACEDEVVLVLKK